jgi:transcriptional regulator with XRE-family HTH domain
MTVLRLKELMSIKGIGREELATKVNVSATTISNISTEKNLPTIQLLLSIAVELDVDVRELFVPTKGTAISQMEVEEAKVLLEKSIRILEGKR